MVIDKKKIKLKLPMKRQPDDVTCGPTCLQSIYAYFNDNIALESVIKEVPMLETGGTYASKLGVHALKRGYKAEIWTFNVNIFDPTWFELSNEELIDKLVQQKNYKKNRKLRTSSEGYIEFLENGGQLHFDDLNVELLFSALKDGRPVIAGLSSTFLYRSIREDPRSNANDDVKGRPAGHFVILTGIDMDARTVQITDPYFPNAISEIQTYTVTTSRLMGALLLGVVTYDANLLVITKKESPDEEPHRR